RLNADLANDLGNLVSRATTMIVNFGHGADAGHAPSAAEDLAIGQEFARARAGVEEAMEEFAFHRALGSISSFLGVVNRYIDATQPWALAKRPDQRDRLAAVLVNLTDALRCLGILLDPFLPDAARRIRSALGLEERPRLDEAVFGRPGPVPRVEKLSGLFPRVAGLEDPSARTEAARADEGRARADEGRARAASPAAKPKVTLQEFQRLDLRVGEVLAAEPVARSKKLLKLTVKLGEETRTVVAGIAEHYAPEALRGRKVVIVANLEPATLMGVESNGMVLAGSAGEILALVGLDRDLPPGAVVR